MGNQPVAMKSERRKKLWQIATIKWYLYTYSGYVTNNTKVGLDRVIKSHNQAHYPDILYRTVMDPVIMYFLANLLFLVDLRATLAADSSENCYINGKVYRNSIFFNSLKFRLWLYVLLQNSWLSHVKMLKDLKINYRKRDEVRDQHQRTRYNGFGKQHTEACRGPPRRKVRNNCVDGTLIRTKPA